MLTWATATWKISRRLSRIHLGGAAVVSGCAGVPRRQTQKVRIDGHAVRFEPSSKGQLAERKNALRKEVPTGKNAEA